MAGVVDVIGIIVGLLGAGLDVAKMTSDSEAPSPRDGTTSNVRVAVGLDSPGGLNQAEGKIDVRLFNENGQELGAPAVDQYCGSGDTSCDITITHDSDKTGQQGTYGLFTGNDDAICIAWTTVTWPDGNKWGWTGDWAAAGSQESSTKCKMGQTWYYSNIVMQNGTSGTYKPNCIWLDMNGDQPATSFQVHWPDFYAANGSLDNAQVSNVDDICGTPSFQVSMTPDNNAITYFTNSDSNTYTNGQTSNHNKRSILSAADRNNPANWAASGNSTVQNVTSQAQPGITGNTAQGPPVTNGKYAATSNETRLVISSDPTHLASVLCEHPYSVGPDLVSTTENLFCDMHAKTTYPLCAGSDNGTATSIVASSSASTTTTAPVGQATRGSTPQADSCFDLGSQQLVTGPGRLARRTGMQYSEVKNWH